MTEKCASQAVKQNRSLKVTGFDFLLILLSFISAHSTVVLFLLDLTGFQGCFILSFAVNIRVITASDI